MKKTVIAMFALVALCAGLYAEGAAAPKGIEPLMVQAAFYTPSYQCIYLKGSDELDPNYAANKWCTYTTAVKKETITYDGMNGKYVGVNVVRVKSNTKKNAQEVVIYIDNLVVRDGAGNVVFQLDFENDDPAGVFISMGKKFPDTATVVSKDGRKCFLMHMKSESMYGYNGLEVQWALPARDGKDPTWDLSKGDFTVSFDYFISVAK